MVTRAENNPFPSILVVEQDKDALTEASPAAGQQRLVVDSTDHTLYLVDSTDTATAVGGGASLTDHTHAATGSGANGGGATLAPTTLTLPTSMGTGEGQVEYDTATDRLNVYDGQRERGVSAVGWATAAYPLSSFESQAAHTTALSLTANGGSLAVPMAVQAHMLLQDVIVRNTDTASARTWMWDLYANYLNNGNSGENTAARVATGAAAESFTASAASNRFISASSAPVYLPPGVYWLVVQNQHASNTFGVGTTAAVGTNVAGAVVSGITKTTTNPNGSTLDLVAATWTKQASSIGLVMRGRVLGMTGAI